MPFVFTSGAKVNWIPFVEEVLRLQSKVRGRTKPRARLCVGVVRIQLVLVRITSLEGDGKRVVTRTSVGLRHGDAAERIRHPKSGGQFGSMCGELRRQDAGRS